MGLFDETLHVTLFGDLGNTELPRVIDVTQQDLRRRCRRTALGARRFELVHEPLKTLFKHVVAQVHDEVFIAEKLVGNQHAVREAERLILRNIGDSHAELCAVSDRRHDFSAGVTNDDADFADACPLHRLDAIEQNRFVGYRHQLFGAGVGDRPQPGASTARQNQTFHRELRLVEHE